MADVPIMECTPEFDSNPADAGQRTVSRCGRFWMQRVGGEVHSGFTEKGHAETDAEASRAIAAGEVKIF